MDRSSEEEFELEKVPIDPTTLRSELCEHMLNLNMLYKDESPSPIIRGKRSMKIAFGNWEHVPICACGKLEWSTKLIKTQEEYWIELKDAGKWLMVIYTFAWVLIWGSGLCGASISIFLLWLHLYGGGNQGYILWSQRDCISTTTSAANSLVACVSFFGVMLVYEA